MPRFDELLGVATVAAAGMVIGLALQPLPSAAPALISIATGAVQTTAAPAVQLPGS